MGEVALVSGLQDDSEGLCGTQRGVSCCVISVRVMRISMWMKIDDTTKDNRVLYVIHCQG